jgi:hypothetical protein
MERKRTSYYDEFIKETRKIIREQDQSVSTGEIVREIESHIGGQEEKERREMSDLDFVDEYAIEEMDTLDKIPMEDKIIMAREEEYPSARELTPGEISRIVNNALRDLPESLVEESGSEISDAMFDVAYAVMNELTE